MIDGAVLTMIINDFVPETLECYEIRLNLDEESHGLIGEAKNIIHV